MRQLNLGQVGVMEVSEHVGAAAWLPDPTPTTSTCKVTSV